MDEFRKRADRSPAMTCLSRPDAVGMSGEPEVGRCCQRLTASSVQFGTADHPLGRYVMVA